jgi:hypothetical protein
VADVQNPALYEALRSVVSSSAVGDNRTTTLERLNRWPQAQQHSDSPLLTPMNFEIT